MAKAALQTDVTMSLGNDFEPVITLTGLEGTKADYDGSPSVSKSTSDGARAGIRMMVRPKGFEPLTF